MKLEPVTLDNIDEGGYQDHEMNLADSIRRQMKRDKKRFWAGDNISDYVDDYRKQILINEATVAFESVLDALLIDRENDPNSKGTAHRLAKMYYNEIMGGRYDPAPSATAFPNDSADRLKVCWLCVASCVVCVAIIINLCLVLLTLELLQPINLLALANILVSLSGVLVVAHFKKNYVMTLPAK